jgi:pimeloyl-ACP methyl ester carboxylesterase
MLNGGIVPQLHQPQLSQTLLAHPLVGPWAQWFMIRPLFGVAISRVFGPKTQPSVVELDEDYALIAHNGGRSTIHAHLQYMQERRVHAVEWEKCLSTSLAPILLLNGPADPVSGAHVATYVAQRITGVDVQSLPSHVGHFPQREMPSVVASAYSKWLERVAPTRPQ